MFKRNKGRIIALFVISLVVEVIGVVLAIAFELSWLCLLNLIYALLLLLVINFIGLQKDRIGLKEKNKKSIEYKQKKEKILIYLLFFSGVLLITLIIGLISLS